MARDPRRDIMIETYKCDAGIVAMVIRGGEILHEGEPQRTFGDAVRMANAYIEHHVDTRRGIA